MTTPQVLIVEDRRPLADLYAEWLADSYDVRTAYTGEQALAELNDDLDVVLLDRRLPDMPGDDVLAVIHERDLNPRVAMVTAIKPNVDVVTMGFDDYLTKPVSRAELRDTVAALLRLSNDSDPLQESISVQSMQASIVESILDGDTVDGLGGVDTGASNAVGGTRLDEFDMGQVDTHVLPQVVSDLADEYQDRLGYRDSFLLKWLHVVFPFFTLSSVDDSSVDQCRADKTLASMFVMLLDDIGERHNDRTTLREAAKIPFPHESVDGGATGVDAAYLDVTASVWDTLEPRLREAPRFEEIEPILRFDLRQVLHAIRYSVLVNERPQMANMKEAQALGAHNMMMLTYADIDIAYSPGFDMDELGAVRSLLLELQGMARIGNWITTWERELEEGDVSAGVFIAAVEKGIISPSDLTTVSVDPGARDRVREEVTNARVEEALLTQWQQRYDQLGDDLPRIDSIDVEGLLAGMEQVMGYHLASRGLK